jgi:5'(3')-deoxyribonucleotidase
VKQDPYFWNRLESYPDTRGALTDLELARSMGHEIYFITHRFGRRAKMQTEGWLMTRGFATPTVLMAERKGFIAHGLNLDVFVDDKPGNLRDVSEATNGDCTCYVFDRPYNRDLTKFPRVKSISELLDIELRGKYPSVGSVVPAGAPATNG